MKQNDMPLYTISIQDGSVPDDAKAKIAAEITGIHAATMKVPRTYVRVIFHCYPKGCGYSAGVGAPTAALNCTLRSGHTIEEKADMLRQLWSMFQDLTGFATDQIAISLQEIPSSNAMEMGQIMPTVGPSKG
jgi:phenylpyruvate tautomerase PptA (4-oxalocrotonate tautomerase family)